MARIKLFAERVIEETTCQIYLFIYQERFA